MFVVGNYEEFLTNSDIHSVYTRQKSHLHPPLPRLAKYQKGVHYMGEIQNLSHNKKHFNKALKNFYYSVHLEEFYNWSFISELQALYI